ncbi:GGDEF domain-containing protein [Sphingomonas sp. Leaf4]|uniref:GGDEF domain-containing protein n=1 Tax=Sphingomonas sp. Leaf4 TaxID=2876553 RepID=UPI001E4CBAC7|nr:diguanylate cyclase [Sphingomonas sp. Leaf4]
MLLALAVFAATPASAQAGIIGDPVALCVRPAQPGDSVRAILAEPARFDCATPQQHFGPGDYWVLSGPVQRHDDDHGALRVRQASLWQRALTLYAIRDDGRIEGIASDASGVSGHLRLGAVVEHRFDDRPGTIRRLLWRIDGAANLRGIVVGARISDDADSIRSDLLLAGLYAGFVGLCTALLIYNLALWKALRHDFQIAYCAMLLCLNLYALSSSGALAWLVPDLPNNSRITLNHVVLSWATAAALAFSRRFFEPRVFTGWVGRSTDGAAIAFFALGAVFMAFAPVAIRLLDQVYSVMFMGVPLVVMPILWRAWARRSNYLWLFSLTWASPIGMVVMRGLYNLNLIEWNFWIDNSTLLAMSAEALLTSLAIAYRIRLLSIERDEAVRQEAISRELADTDPLTGLLNRRAFMARAIAADGPRTLMLFDIDHFKQVNDTIGHDGGDEVLRIFARVLRDHRQDGVLLARMGGEEFAMLGPARAMPDPDAVLSVVRAQNMPFDLRVTTSIGMCHGPLANEGDWKKLYRLADQALFHAKAAGRDRTERARPLALAA